jgi:hypothetical protein
VGKITLSGLMTYYIDTVIERVCGEKQGNQKQTLTNMPN